jgi:glutamate 5-kinase
MTEAAEPAVGRLDIAESPRTVVKIGSSSLTTRDGAIDDARIAALTSALAARVRGGGQVLLVSSGAIAAGLAPLGLRRRPRDLATQQASGRGCSSPGTPPRSPPTASAPGRCC